MDNQERLNNLKIHLKHWKDWIKGDQLVEIAEGELKELAWVIQQAEEKQELEKKTITTSKR